MTTVAGVRVGHPELPLTPTLETVPDLRVRREYTGDQVDGDRLAFIAVSGDLDAFDTGIATDPTVRDPLVVADPARGPAPSRRTGMRRSGAPPRTRTLGRITTRNPSDTTRSRGRVRRKYFRCMFMLIRDHGPPTVAGSASRPHSAERGGGAGT